MEKHKLLVLRMNFFYALFVFGGFGFLFSGVSGGIDILC
jgi:hypothetical protein